MAPSGRGGRSGRSHERGDPARAGLRGGSAILLRTKVRLALEAAAEKKAEDPVTLDLRRLASFADCFLICTGQQKRQTQAISDAIVERLETEGLKPGHVEGYAGGDWILVDYADLIVHIFTPTTREFYGLERLWGDAKPLRATAPARRARRRPASRP